MPEYVTVEALTALLGASAPADRVLLAVGGANVSIEEWCEQAPDVDGNPVPAPVDDITQQAGLELAHELYRAHAAVGGVFLVDELLARLPADRVRPIRDLLDARTQLWGLA